MTDKRCLCGQLLINGVCPSFTEHSRRMRIDAEIAGHADPREWDEPSVVEESEFFEARDYPVERKKF